MNCNLRSGHQIFPVTQWKTHHRAEGETFSCTSRDNAGLCALNVVVIQRAQAGATMKPHNVSLHKGETLQPKAFKMLRLYKQEPLPSTACGSVIKR